MRIQFRQAAGNKGGGRLLSSAALILLSCCATPVLAQSSGYQNSAYEPMQATISQWRALQQSDALGFSTYAAFMLAHPGWPGEAAMRKTAERAIRADIESPAMVVGFFRRFPPQSPSARLRYAEALDATGERRDAREAARLAWVSGALTTTDEARLIARYGSTLSSADHDQRMDRLLWARATTAAQRQIGYTSASRRPLFDVRLALLTKASDAAIKASAADGYGRADAGYLADKAYWYRATNQWVGARSLLAAPRRLSTPPADPAKWLEVLLVNAQAAQTDRQWMTAYDIARQLDDTYPAGTVVRERPFEERDDYTSLAWIGASTALNQLGRPVDAIRLFDLYANAARTPQTRSKGWYWAGRAAEAARQPDLARQHYNAAAQYIDQFHGQLAAERLGKSFVRPVTTSTLEISSSVRSAFERREVVRAAILLGAQGNWQDQTRFVRTIATTASTPEEMALAAQLSQRIGRPDLGLLVGKAAREADNPDYLLAAFPTVSVPVEHGQSWTMIHAIARQESQFDRQATSPVGAKGLMQLMPGTARETAPSAGVTYDYASLIDPQYNIRLGSTYFGKMMTLYGGSYVLAVAAYNAGPGNVNKWIRANGDPRLPGTDVLRWIDAITLPETRNYVQRVLENAVVYDLLNPRNGGRLGSAPLSAYLGKSQPG